MRVGGDVPIGVVRMSQATLVPDGGRPTGSFGDYLGAVYRSGNHASIEGYPTPSRAAVHRIASIAAGVPRGGYRA